MKHVLLATTLALTPIAANANIFSWLAWGTPLDERVENMSGHKAGEGDSHNYLFENKLQPGSVLPHVKDGRALLIAAQMDQTVKVAGDVWNFDYPVLVEIARQNRVSVSWLRAYLNEHWVGSYSGVHDVVRDVIGEIANDAIDLQIQRAQEQALHRSLGSDDDPIVEPEAPIVEPEAPVMEPEDPTPEPEAPIVEPETPIVEPKAPTIVVPEAPVDDTQARIATIDKALKGANLRDRPDHGGYDLIIEVLSRGSDDPEAIREHFK